jgi:hypothetical protein
MSLRPGARRVFERFAALACPPDLVELGLMPDLLREFELQLRCLPAGARRLVAPTLRLFNQSARLRPGGRGRSFARLEDARADAYLRAMLDGRGALPDAVRLVKSLVVMCYYELPPVKQRLGYRPEVYIGEVSARRLARYGAQIAAAEAASAGDQAEAQ